jgi:hypothetical protein
MAKESNTLPTKIELSGEMLLAPTEERRLAAKRLLESGAYRDPTRDEAQAQHHYFVAQAFKGSDSPVMKQIREFVAKLPPEERLAPEPAQVEVLPATPVPELPATIDIAAPIEATLEGRLKASSGRSTKSPPEQAGIPRPTIDPAARLQQWIDDTAGTPIY